MQKLASLQSNVLASAFEESVGAAQALIRANNPQEFFATQRACARPGLERAAIYSMDTYKVAREAGIELSRLAEAGVSEWRQAIDVVMDEAEKSAPAGADAVFAAARAMLSTAQSAYDGLNEIARQAAHLPDETIAATGAKAGNSGKSRKAPQ